MITLAAGGSPSPLWYATRGTGLLALILLTATVVLGLLATVRFATPRWPRLLTAGLHRNVSLLVLAFLAVHILTAVLDSFAPVGWWAIVIPFASAYRPLWLGLGTVAFDLLLAITITSLIRVRVGQRVWRYVHWAAYACWPVALAHGLGTGTDTRLGWVLGINAACVAAVLAALGWRLAQGWPDHPGVRIGSAAVSAVAPIVLVVWLGHGPLAPHWAARAGTPASLLGGAAATTTATGGGHAQRSSGALPAAPFTAALDGTVQESAANNAGQVEVHIVAQLSAGAAGTLDIVIIGTPDGGGGVSLSSSQVSLGPVGSSDPYRGQITSLAGDQVGALLSSGTGGTLQADATLRINGTRVTGRLRASVGGHQ